MRQGTGSEMLTSRLNQRLSPVLGSWWHTGLSMLIAAESLLFPGKCSAVFKQRCFSIPHHLTLSQDKPLLSHRQDSPSQSREHKSSTCSPSTAVMLRDAQTAQTQPSAVISACSEGSLCSAKELQTCQGFLWQSLGKAQNIPIHFPLSINWPKPPPAARAQQSSWAQGLFLPRILHTITLSALSTNKV